MTNQTDGGQSVDPGAQPSFLSRAVRNFFFSGFGTASNFVLGFLFAGLTIRYLGEGRAGFFMALAALTGLNAFLGDLGLGTAAVRRIAALTAGNDFDRARLVIGSVFTASLASALVVALPVIIFFPKIFVWSRLDAIYRQDAFWAAVCTLGSFILTQASNSWRTTFTAMERYDLITALSTLFGFLSGICGLIVLACIPTMTAVSFVRLLLNAVRFLTEINLVRRLLRGMAWPDWTWREIRPMIGFGGWVYVGSVGRILLGRVNSLVLTTCLGSAALPYYEFPQRIYGQMHGALASQAQFLFPMFSSYGEDAQSQIRSREDRLRWLIAAGSGIVYTGLLLVGPEILARLVSPSFAAHATIPLYLACIQGFFQAQDIVLYYSSWAVGQARQNSAIEMIQGILVAATAALIIPHTGYVGASISQLWVIPCVALHTIWIQRLIMPGLHSLRLLRAFASPWALMATWILLTSGITRVLPPSPIVKYASAAVGMLAGILVLILVEHLWFREESRWETLKRILSVPIMWFRRSIAF